MKGIIYKYTSPSNKVYIGQTIHEHRRYMTHKRCYGDTKFCRSIRKYGFENFTYEVIFTIDNEDRKRIKEKLDFMERYYIRKYDSFKNGYNMTLGGDGGAGTKHTEEFKEKISERMKKNNPAWNMTDEWRLHIGYSQRGKKMSQEFCKKTSERMKNNNPMKNPEVAAKHAAALKGKHLSEEHKKKISEYQKGKVVTDETKIKMKENATKRHRDSKGHFIKEEKL